MFFHIFRHINTNEMLFTNQISLQLSAFASSVFPTPVGPRNKNEPIGLIWIFNTSSCTPIPLLSLIVLLHLVLLHVHEVYLLNASNFSRSPSTSFVTGIPVHLETIEAISSAVTSSRSKRVSCIFIYFILQMLVILFQAVEFYHDAVLLLCLNHIHFPLPLILDDSFSKFFSFFLNYLQ